MKSYLNKPVAAIAVLFTLFLSACSTFQPSSNAPLPKDIKQLDSWTVRGKILIKTATDKESGYLYWHKNNNTSQFSLNAFIGVNILKLTTANGLSTLEFGGNVYQDTNPTRLIKTITGIDLPLAHLEYWVRGQLKGKETSITKQNNQIKQFAYFSQQQNWQVKYSKYQPQKIYQLPMNITLTGDQTRLKLSISSWEF